MKNPIKQLSNPISNLSGNNRLLAGGIDPGADILDSTKYLGDKVGDMVKAPKIDTSGTAAANKAIADAQTAANNLKTNFGTDLTTDNLTDVNAGASAADSANLMTDMTKRKRPGSSGLSSALGIGG